MLKGYPAYIWHSTLLELQNRFAGSAFGLIWLVIQPLAQILLFVVVFSRIMEFQLQGMHGGQISFAVYLCSAFLPWIGFAEIVTRSTTGLLSSSQQVMSLGLPEHIVFMKEACAGTISMFVGVMVFLGVSLAMGPGWYASWLLIPLVLLLFAGLALGIGMVMGVLNVLWRDTGQSVGILLQILMWTTPIVYVETILPAEFLSVLSFVPTYPFVTAIHDVMLYGRGPELVTWLTMIGFTGGSIGFGFGLLRLLRSEIRDRLYT